MNSASKNGGSASSSKAERMSPMLLTNGWTARQNRSFVELLKDDSTNRALAHDSLLVASCLKMMVRKMISRHPEGTWSEYRLRQKLEQLRMRSVTFSKFRKVPGVVYEKEYDYIYTDPEYSNHVKEEGEPELYAEFRESDCKLELELEVIFDHHGVAPLPSSIEGSYGSPIVIKDDVENRLAPVNSPKALDFSDSDDDMRLALVAYHKDGDFDASDEDLEKQWESIYDRRANEAVTNQLRLLQSPSGKKRQAAGSDGNGPGSSSGGGKLGRAKLTARARVCRMSGDAMLARKGGGGGDADDEAGGMFGPSLWKI